jgi:hypothetical protein
MNTTLAEHGRDTALLTTAPLWCDMIPVNCFELKYESGNALFASWLASDYHSGIRLLGRLTRENGGHRVYATCCFISSHSLLHPSVEADLVAGRTRGCMPILTMAIRIVVFTNPIASGRGLRLTDPGVLGIGTLLCSLFEFFLSGSGSMDPFADPKSIGALLCSLSAFSLSGSDLLAGLHSWRKRSHSRN